MLAADSFSYDLPGELIAQHPLAERDHSRLLVLDRKTGRIEHRRFFDIAGYFAAGDALVLNDTRVFKARLRGRKATGGQIEMLLVREIGGSVWEALAHNTRRLGTGSKIFFTERYSATIVDRLPGRCRIEFNAPAGEIIAACGIVPLPHYIRRAAVDSDEQAYQTVYAGTEGSIAAPTAGRHFTPGLLAGLETRGVVLCRLTLHIGPGTFRPIRVADVRCHVMDAEYAEITAGTAAAINNASGVTGVGTSVARTLESVVPVRAFSGFTDLFICPGHRFRVINRLITNFHMSGSTPLLLVCAFAGRDLIFDAYRAAIKERYRFLSYGDAMLII